MLLTDHSFIDILNVNKGPHLQARDFGQMTWRQMENEISNLMGYNSQSCLQSQFMLRFNETLDPFCRNTEKKEGDDRVTGFCVTTWSCSEDSSEVRAPASCMQKKRVVGLEALPFLPICRKGSERISLYLWVWLFSVLMLQMHLVPVTESRAWLCFSMLQIHSETNLQLAVWLKLGL